MAFELRAAVWRRGEGRAGIVKNTHVHLDGKAVMGDLGRVTHWESWDMGEATR